MYFIEVTQRSTKSKRKPKASTCNDLREIKIGSKKVLDRLATGDYTYFRTTRESSRGRSGAAAGTDEGPDEAEKASEGRAWSGGRLIGWAGTERTLLARSAGAAKAGRRSPKEPDGQSGGRVKGPARQPLQKSVRTGSDEKNPSDQ